MTGIHTVELDGSGWERGRRFGSANKDRISLFLGDWMDSIKATGIECPGNHVKSMLYSTDYVSYIKQYTPDLLEELKGVADASGWPECLVLGSQLMDEEWLFRNSVLGSNEPFNKCTSLAIVQDKGEPVWIAQNMDLGGFTDGHQLLLKIAGVGTTPGALVFTIGCMIGLMGVNSAGVGVFVNALPQLPHASSGLPVAFVIRALLRARTLDEAERLVREIPHATGQHYLVADLNDVRSFEASPRGVVRCRPQFRGQYFHTNHPLKSGSVGGDEVDQNSLVRLRSLIARFGPSRPVDLVVIEQALSSFDDPVHPICRLPNSAAAASLLTGMISFTTGSMIARLDKQSDVVSTWLSAGPPSERGYSRVDLPRQ